MTSINPGSTIQADASSGNPTEQKSTSGAAWITNNTPAASVQVNLAIVADVNAAVAAVAGLRLMGYAVRETAAAVANVVIVHGATVGASTYLVPVKLAANESKVHNFGPDGLACPNGISIDWVAGTLDVIIYYKVLA